MDNTVHQPSKRSKSARKDANRMRKIRDKSNYVVWYPEQYEVAETLNVFAQQSGTALSVGWQKTVIVDHQRTFSEYKSVRNHAITQFAKAGFTRFYKTNLYNDEVLEWDKGEKIPPYNPLTKKISLETYTRKFWGKIFEPELILVWDDVNQAYFMGLLIFDPEFTADLELG